MATAPRKPQRVEEAIMEQRLRVSEQIRERFARYGDEVCGAITAAALRPSGLQNLLNQLGLPPSPRYDQQLIGLQRYLATLGSLAFIQTIRQAERNKAQAPARVSQPMVNPFEGMTIGNGMDEPVAFNNGAGSSLMPLAEPSRPAPPCDAKTPAVNSPPANSNGARATTPAHHFDAEGRYIGPERRKSADRRASTPDRRGQIEAISSNRRYGGDRRKTNRRSSDRKN